MLRTPHSLRFREPLKAARPISGLCLMTAAPTYLASMTCCMVLLHLHLMAHTFVFLVVKEHRATFSAGNNRSRMELEQCNAHNLCAWSLPKRAVHLDCGIDCGPKPRHASQEASPEPPVYCWLVEAFMCQIDNVHGSLGKLPSRRAARPQGPTL